MAVEYDLSPNFQFTPFATVSYVQWYDAIAKTVPNTDKGFWITGATAPDVANNPRYANYYWWDTANTTPKRWNGAAWVAFPAGSITSAGQITDGIITLAKLNQVEGTNGHFLRKNPTTGTVEWTNLLAAIANGTFDILKLSVSGGSEGQVLTIYGGVPVWRSLASSGSSSVDPQNIGGRSAGTVLISDASNVAGWKTFTDFFSNHIANLVIPLTKLAAGGASSGQSLVFNGTNWAASNNPNKFTQEFIWTDSTDYGSGQTIAGDPVTGKLNSTAPIKVVETPIITFKPKLVRVFYYCHTVDNTVPVGTEIPIEMIRHSGPTPAGTQIPPISYGVREVTAGTAYKIMFDFNDSQIVSGTSYYIGVPASMGTPQAQSGAAGLNTNKWRLKVYAYA